MSQFLNRSFIREMTYGNNFAYILENKDSFLPTEYKVLQNQTDSCFVKCAKMHFNGKIQLYYIVDTLKPMSIVLPNINAEDFLTLVTNLIGVILETKDIGFLSCLNVDLSLNKIFVDPVTLKVKLVYVPSGEHLTRDVSTFNQILRTELMKVIDDCHIASVPKIAMLRAGLADHMLLLENLYTKLRGGVSLPVAEKPEPEKTEQVCRLVAMNAPNRVEYVVNKDHFLIGKDATVDADASFNKSISRIHCAVDKAEGKYTVTDLGSTNGTFINGIRLTPKTPYPIENGDVLKLANTKFQIIL